LPAATSWLVSRALPAPWQPLKWCWARRAGRGRLC
jgi:hypothetical protein